MENNRHRIELPTFTPPIIIVGRQHPCYTDITKSHSRQAIQVLDDLNQSITPSERWQTLQRALHLSSHDNIELHNNEISIGMDKALCLKLGYAAVTTQKDAIYVPKEIVLICRCLIQVFKCSSEHRLRSFQHVGVTELIPLLIQIWTSIIPKKIKKELQSSENNEGLLSIIRIIRVFSKLIPAKSILINYLNGAFLGHLLRDILIWIREPNLSILYSSPEVLWEAMGLIKDLTFRSQTADKEVLIRLEEGILLETISVCCENMKSLHPRIQEWCTSVIWNLVLDRSICQILLSKDFGKVNKDKEENIILVGLLQVLKDDCINEKKTAISLKIRRNTISAIGNIVVDSRHHKILFQNAGTASSSSLIPRLINLVENDLDPVVRRRAMRTIRCLAFSTDITTKFLVEEENLSSFLVDVISRNPLDDDENDRDMLVQACQTVIALRESIKAEDWSHLQKALVQQIETTSFTKIMSAAIQCLVECMRKNSSARSPSSEIFWKRLEISVSNNSEMHTHISSLLVILARIERRMVDFANENFENQSILTSTPVVNTVTTILLESGASKEDSRNQALEAVLILTENERNKRPLAENDRLLSGLVALCLMQPDPKKKDSIKQVILQLVPEI